MSGTDHQAASPVLRLVVDNDASAIARKSAALTSHPLRSASLSIVRCQRPGIEPRRRHMETVELSMPSREASAPVPPKASMISDADLGLGRVLMSDTNISQSVRIGNRKSSQNVHTTYFTRRDITTTNAQDARMVESQKKKLTLEQKVAAYRRVLIALKERHGIDVVPHGGGKRAADFFDVKPNTFGMWRTRGVSAHEIPHVAERLNVDMAFLLGLTDAMGYFRAGEPPHVVAQPAPAPAEPPRETELSREVRLMREVMEATLIRLRDVEARLAQIETEGPPQSPHEQKRAASNS